MILAATVSTAIAAGALLVDAGGAEASGTGASAEAPRATPHPLPSMGGAGHQPRARLPPSGAAAWATTSAVPSS